MLRSLGRGLAWAAFALVGLVAVLVLVVPSVIGAQRYTILGGSMEPAIPLGSLVVVQPREFDDVRGGDVITFQLESGEAAVVTHRVVGEGRTSEGERVLVTRGDANDSADIEPVREPQLRGVLVYSIPLLGWMNVLISGELRDGFCRSPAGSCCSTPRGCSSARGATAGIVRGRRSPIGPCSRRTRLNPRDRRRPRSRPPHLQLSGARRHLHGSGARAGARGPRPHMVGGAQCR